MTYGFVERGARYVDVTGDGKADCVRSQNVYSGAKTRSFYENQNPPSSSFSSWVAGAATSTSVPMFGYQSASGNYTTGLFGNVNGDGLVDYVVSLPAISSNQDTNGTYLHQGTSTAMWALATSTFSPVSTMPTQGTDTHSNELVDINGDGLDDWMYGGSSISFSLNTGSGWQATSAWDIATTTRHANGWDRGIRFIDINGDGLPDYVRSYSISYSSKAPTALDIEKGTYNYVYLNTGSGWATSTLQVPTTIASADNFPADYWNGKIFYNELVDWNGDGILDTDTQTSTTTKPDLLTRITLTTGGTKEVGYTFSAQQASVNPNLAFPMLLVASTTNSDGFGTRETTQYTYEGGKMYLAGDVRDRRFAGFEKITKQDALGLAQTYYHQGDTASTTAGETSDSFALLGKPYREDVLSASSNTLKKTFYRWNAAGTRLVTTTATIHIRSTSNLRNAVCNSIDHRWEPDRPRFF